MQLAIAATQNNKLAMSPDVRKILNTPSPFPPSLPDDFSIAPEVEVIGLLKSDASMFFTGAHDPASWLGERLHMHTDDGPGIKEHTSG